MLKKTTLCKQELVGQLTRKFKKGNVQKPEPLYLDNLIWIFIFDLKSGEDLVIQYTQLYTLRPKRFE